MYYPDHASMMHEVIAYEADPLPFAWRLIHYLFP